MIRNATIDDAPRIAEIYNYYVSNSTSTFEERPLSGGEMATRMEAVMQTYPWIVTTGDTGRARLRIRITIQSAQRLPSHGGNERLPAP